MRQRDRNPEDVVQCSSAQLAVGVVYPGVYLGVREAKTLDRRGCDGCSHSLARQAVPDDTGNDNAADGRERHEHQDSPHFHVVDVVGPDVVDFAERKEPARKCCRGFKETDVGRANIQGVETGEEVQEDHEVRALCCKGVVDAEL